VADRAAPTAIIDIDGTLVDSNYHHVLAWDRALRTCDVKVPLWKIHRHMGMGGDQLVEAVADARVERDLGEDIRAAEKLFYGQLLPEVRAVEGATEAIASLRESGWTVVLASSAKSEEVDHYIEMLGADGLASDSTDSGDVDATKPSPDLIEAALDKAQGGEALMVGDSVWDVEAAAKAGVPSVAVLSGGFPEADLTAAGAIEVLDSVGELADAAGRLRRRGFSPP
jgi:phosphoglycolate phosphatase-like HAD superfamily hydrolase